jgi:hypothetical protein
MFGGLLKSKYGFWLNLQHSSLHAKKYDEAHDVLAARVNRAWRFFFTITDDTTAWKT